MKSKVFSGFIVLFLVFSCIMTSCSKQKTHQNNQKRKGQEHNFIGKKKKKKKKRKILQGT